MRARPAPPETGAPCPPRVPPPAIRPILRIALSVIAVAGLVGAFLPASGRAAASTWAIDLSPDTMTVGDIAPIKVLFSNLGGADGDTDLGCVRIAIPTAFTVLATRVTAQPSGSTWLTHQGGLTTVTIQASNGGDRLPPHQPTATVTDIVTVTSVVPGTYVWKATAFRSQDCTEPFADVANLTVTVDLNVLPTPTPTPKATPTPTPTPRPTPTPTPTPVVTPQPGATATPSPTGAPAAATPSPTPGATQGQGSSPAPNAAPVRSEPPAPSASAPGDAAAPSGGPSAPPPGAAILMPGTGSGGDGTEGPPAISLTSGFGTPFGEGFAWAVPGLVLSVPGLLLVLVVIGIQALGAFAWLPVVRRRIGAFGLRGRPSRRAPGPGRSAGA